MGFFHTAVIKNGDDVDGDVYLSTLGEHTLVCLLGQEFEKILT